MLQPSCINLLILAYTQVHDIFDFNRTPLALAGCKIIIHDRTKECPTWANHGSQWFYVGPAIKPCQKYKYWMLVTKSIRTSNTVEFFPLTCDNPTITDTDTLLLILDKLLSILQNPPPMSSFLPHTLNLANTIDSPQSIFFKVILFRKTNITSPLYWLYWQTNRW